jgi:hypothetical protein
MKDFEKKISSLIESQFPAFYKEEGQKFITFVKAYYEWLEQEDNALYHGRRLLNYRDIDETVEDFIVNFKEKYLSNIQFTVATNKKLLVKKAQDLYRSKGTPRAIDLFFKLVYGVEARIYIPGQDVFKASDGKYIKPIYLEVTRQARNIDYIGKQITGASSGAIAFVEKLVRRRIKGQYIDIFYVSAIDGNFTTNEVLLIDEVFDDAPIMIGSMTGLTVVTKATGYEIGDIVDVVSNVNGEYGKARVTSISNASGVVEFELIEGGFGYTSSANVIISEKVLTLGNVTTSNASLSTPYRLFETVSQPIANVTYQPVLAVPIVSNTGAFTGGEVVYQETGGANTALATVISSNTSTILIKYANTGVITSGLTLKGATSGANAVIGNFTDPSESISVGDIYTNYYTNNVIAGQGIVVQNFTNSTPYIGVLKVAITNGNIYNSTNTNYSETVYVGNTSAPNTLRFTLSAYANVYATANVMGIPDRVTLYLTNYVSSISATEIISQGSTANGVVSTVELDGSNAYVTVSETKGVFQLGSTATTGNGSGNVSHIGITLGVHDINNSFTNVGFHYISGGLSNTYANVITVSEGTGATFSITGFDNEEQVVVGTDRISGLNNSGIAYNTLNINATYYGFPKFPSGNVTNGTLLQQLTYFSGNVGTISSIGNINPGADYNIDPFVIIYDPYIAPFNRKDLLITYNQDTLADFIPDEIITQSIVVPNTSVVGVTGVTGTFAVNEQVRQSNSSGPVANGYISSISIIAGSGTITVRNVQGTFVNTGFNTANNLVGYTSAANGSVSNTSAVSITNVAKGIIKEVANTTLVVKPITFNTQFISSNTSSRIIGTSSGANGVVTAISEIADSLPSGLNAEVQADVITANGVVNALQRIDSGFGYIANQVVSYQKSGGTVGTARVLLGQQGVGEGYYNSTDGFLSFDKKLFDGDYYQEYSYEIISKLPFEKYADIFKQVLHISGTRVFGAVELYSLDNSDALPVHNGNKIVKLQVSNLSNTENFSNNEVIYQSNGSANVASGKYYGGRETEITLSSSANTRYQVDTLLYQPNTSVNAASGVIKGKVANVAANTLTLYLSNVAGSFVSTSNVQGTTNTVINVSYYLEVDIINVANPEPTTGSFIFGETVTTAGGFTGTVRYANVFEVEIVPVSGTLSNGDTLTGQTSLCTADVDETTGTTATTGDYVYHPKVKLYIENVANGPYLASEEVYTQEQSVAAGQVFQKRGIGTIDTANSSVIVLKDLFAGFNRGATLFGATSGATARISRIERANSAVGYVIASNTSSITIVDMEGVFVSNTHVYGNNVAANITSISKSLYITPSSNVACTINTILVANVTGQFTTSYQIVGANNGATANVLYVDRYND